MGVVLAVAGVVAAWFVVSEIQEARARAEAARQAELFKEREAAERAAVRKQNEAAIATGPLPVLSRLDSALRVLAVRFNGGEDATMFFALWARNFKLCPELVQLDDSPEPKDEFAARDRKAAREKLISGCAEQFRAEVAKKPRIYVANCIASEDPRYEFDKGRFIIRMKNCELPLDTTWRIEGDYVAPLVLEGAGRSGVIDEDKILLAMDESRARTFRTRLSSATQLQIAYEIGQYGRTSLYERENDAFKKALGQTLRPMTGFTGRAVAFRLVTGSDTLIGWTRQRRGRQGRAGEDPVRPFA